MKYLITGITGFAGPHLASLLLSHGHEVHGLIRGTSGRETDILDILIPEELFEIKFQKTDLLNYFQLSHIIKKEQYNGVFHLAAQSHPGISFSDPVKTFQENVLGSVYLIEAIRTESKDTILHFCSTSEVYGNQSKDIGTLFETFQLIPNNPYGASKASIDIYMQERIRNGFINGFVTRAFSHTGPRRFKNFSIASDAYQLAEIQVTYFTDHPIDRILKIGNLKTERVVIDVRDTVNAYYLLMQLFENKADKPINGDFPHVFNVCGTQVRKMQYFTDELIRISGLKNVQQVINPDFFRPVDIQVQVGNCDRLKDLTGWKPDIPIEKTLQDLFEYWVKKLS